MKGTTIKYTPARGKPTFGYTFYAGRDEHGKRIQRVKRGFETRAAAEAALRLAIDEYERPPEAPAPAPEPEAMPTFAEFLARWMREGGPRECSTKTIERYAQLGQYAVRRFGDVPLDRLTVLELQTAVHHWSDRGGRVDTEHPQGRPLSPKSVRHISFLVQDCLQQAVDWDILGSNPMLKVRKPKMAKRRPKIVDRAGYDVLLKAAAGTRIFPFLVMGAATGMRRGELCAVEWSDLNWDRATLEVSKSLEQTKTGGLRIKGTKSDRTRNFSIPEEVLEVLREHRRQQDHDRALYGAGYHDLNLIFARPDGYYYSPDRIGARVRETMQKAGLRGLSLHSLRHSHASELLSQGAPVTAVAERLGHANPNITLGIYSHALPADNQAAAKLWNAALGDVIRESRNQDVRRRMLSNVIKTGAEEKVLVLKSKR